MKRYYQIYQGTLFTMEKKNKTDNKISISKNKVWEFNKQVTESFDNHVKKSVPGYLEGHNLILSLCRDLLSNDSKILDIGCSTGVLLMKINNSINLNLNLTGIDISKSMIAHSKKNNKFNKIKFYQKDIDNLNQNNFDLIISYFTFQFIHPSKKDQFIKNVYNKLNNNCHFIIFEKVIESNGYLQNLFFQSYNDFKKINKFKPLEIFNKTEVLRGAMHPITRNENYKIFKNNGFKKIDLISKNIFFEGYLLKK